MLMPLRNPLFNSGWGARPHTPFWQILLMLKFYQITSWFYYAQFSHFWGFLVITKKLKQNLKFSKKLGSDLRHPIRWKTKILTKNTHGPYGGRMIMETDFFIKGCEKLFLIKFYVSQWAFRDQSANWRLRFMLISSINNAHFLDSTG